MYKLPSAPAATAESFGSASTAAGTANSETAKVTGGPGISSGGSFRRFNPGERRMESRPDSDPDESGREASARESTSTQLESADAAAGAPRARVASAAEADGACDSTRNAARRPTRRILVPVPALRVSVFENMGSSFFRRLRS